MMRQQNTYGGVKMIYLMRHGKDDENYVGGWSNIDLTKEGIQEVKEVAKYIKNNLNINEIYSSDIKRAITTAKIVSNETNITPTYTNEFRELSKGDLAGLEVKNALEKFPSYFKNVDIHTKYPNGESMLDLYNRMKVIIDKIIKLENALIVTHRGNINMIYYIFNNIPLDMNKTQFNVTHASIHEIDSIKRKIRRIK